MKLNNKQIEAIEFMEGPCLVLAGAGSGKTRVLTERVANLIENKVSPYNILAITFTNKAAKEMRERIENKIGSVANNVFIGTFHSFGLKILRENATILGYTNNITILDRNDSISLIKKIIKDNFLDDDKLDIKHIINQISFAKNEGLTPEEYSKYMKGDINETIAIVYKKYLELLKRNNSVDFDDLLILPLKILKENKDVLEKYQEHFKYILIDEYQDTNGVQYELCNIIAKKYRNIFVVGDIDQCLPEGTKIETEQGIKNIEDITVNDKVLSACGFGKTGYQLVENIYINEYNGKIVTIKTKNNKEIKITPEHIMFYKLNENEEIQYFVYLMYKKDYGYRIGQTRTTRSDGIKTKNGLKQRLIQEHADKIWIIKKCKTQEEASYYELYYSITYGIPQMCFHDIGRKLLFNKSLIKKFFNEIDTYTRAKILMNDEMLFEEYPHYMLNAFTKTNQRRVINLTYLNGRINNSRNFHASSISFITLDNELKQTLNEFNIKTRSAKKDKQSFRIETERITHDEIKKYAEKLNCFLPNTEIIEKYKITKNNLFYSIPAGSLKPGMIIAVQNNDIIEEDEVISVAISNEKTIVYDLNILNTRNFIANEVCVHNCIYAFRFANYENVLNFEKHYKDAKVILLEQNYRSTKNILNAANSVIKNNTLRKEKNLWTESEEGKKIQYIRCNDEKEEAKYIVDKIKEYNNYGVSLNDIGILYRTNAQSRVIEETLLKENVPYKIVGSYYFYNRKEIKDLISYLYLIYNKNDDVSLLRVINTPKRGIGPKVIEKLEKISNQKNISLFDSIEEGKELVFQNMILSLIEESKNISLTELVDLVLDKSGLRRELENGNDIEKSKLENLEEFKSITKNFEENGIYNLGEFLESIALVSDMGQYKNVNNGVNAMTLHSAKGLEFDIVFLPGMEEGIFPHFRSFEKIEELEEERRLCYVGITRARKELYLLNTNARTLYGKTNRAIPSRFIDEITPDLLESNINEVNKISFINNQYEEGRNENLKIGDNVIHDKFGEGVVVNIDGTIATIAFRHGVGIKSLASNHKALKKK